MILYTIPLYTYFILLIAYIFNITFHILGLYSSELFYKVKVFKSSICINVLSKEVNQKDEAKDSSLVSNIMQCLVFFWLQFLGKSATINHGNDKSWVMWFFISLYLLERILHHLKLD